MKILLTSILALFLCVPSFGQAISSTQMGFTYTVPANATTSAGVYDTSGALVRTMWAGKYMLAGTYRYIWDGKNDAGTSVSAGTYQIKVLQNNVTYTWDGPIGFTSNDWTKTVNTWSNFGYMPTGKICLQNDIGWIAGGYTEGPYNIGWLQLDNLNTPHPLGPNFNNQTIAFNDCATDGQHLYLINNGGLSATTTYATVFDSNTGAPSAFTNGTTLVGTAPGSGAVGFFTYNLSIIDSGGVTAAVLPTGIAVQRSGNLLAIAHGGSNVVRFFDKGTGLASGSNLTITNPTQMAFSSAGLWVISNGTLQLITSPSVGNTTSQPIPGLSNPVGVAVNGSTNHVFVIDGGTSQQVKEFDTSYNLVRTYGSLGGYTDNNPNISNTRLMLDNTAVLGTGSTNGSWITVNDNNDVLFMDGGTANRVMHITPSNTYAGMILYDQPNYHVVVDQNNPTRVFRGLFEYAINYNVPNNPGNPDPAFGGNGSWTLVRNWYVGNTSIPQTENLGDFFLSVEDLSNGRTYGTVQTVPGNQANYEVELPSNGTPLRYTGNTPGQFGSLLLEPDGSIMTLNLSGSTYTVTKASLTGFSGSNNPIRSSAVTVATVNYTSTDPNGGVGGWGQRINPWPSTAGVYPFYQASPSGTTGHPHLGGIIAGRTSYLFETSPEAIITIPDGKCSFPGTAGFGGHAGITTQSVGHHIFTAYDGQYATWGNNFCDYWDDGLLIGQFTQANSGVAKSYNTLLIGQIGTQGAIPLQISGFAGNIGNFVATAVGSDIHAFNSSEAGFPPFDEWLISNTSSIHEYAASGPLGSNVVLTLLF